MFAQSERHRSLVHETVVLQMRVDDCRYLEQIAFPAAKEVQWRRNAKESADTVVRIADVGRDHRYRLQRHRDLERVGAAQAAGVSKRECLFSHAWFPGRI